MTPVGRIRALSNLNDEDQLIWNQCNRPRPKIRLERIYPGL
ncbi:hypothetical protein MICAH_440017 [Microcystis aeruginosa PCC 9809]|uniref:Uncharacterized protein n=1 Tax=Microcystis aeruginosa PCC 9809 TaxID=1160285 RepID=I4HZU8_MICAE|nr:hypothetical protein MICAH_440017 [Microcystis aeruginosa PCC 9809]